jgi:predicted alpha/beta hydrolase
MMLTWLLSLMVVVQAVPAPERVTITTADGSRLGARFYDAGPKTPGVVFFPMCSAGADEGWAPVAERLRGAGVSSLMVTYRGSSGNTTGTGTGDQRGADADAALAHLRTRLAAGMPVAFAGSSCGVWIALRTAAAHPAGTRAVVVLSGPHSDGQVDYVRKTPALAVFSGASLGEPPSPEWARALKDASAHPASRVVLLEQRAHGTELFGIYPTLAGDIAGWLAAQLKGT